MVKKAPYYEGDTVIKHFEVSDRRGPLTPTSAEYVVVDDVDNVFHEGMADIQDNIVTAVIPTKATQGAGTYIIIYTVHLPNGAIRSHRQRFRILPKGPVVSEAFDKTGMPIDENSKPSEINFASGNATRALRRLGKSAKEAAEAVAALVEKKTGRRISL